MVTFSYERVRADCEGRVCLLTRKNPAGHIHPRCDLRCGSMNKFTFDGSWNEIKGKLRQKYAELTDDDLQFAEGKGEEFLGRLQTRLGVGGDEMQRVLIELKQQVEEIHGNARSTFETAKHKISEVASDVKAKVTDSLNPAAVSAAAEKAWQSTKDKAGDALQTGERYVREHPGTSVLSTFGFGLLVGLAVGWSVAHEAHENYSDRALRMARRWGNKLNIE